MLKVQAMAASIPYLHQRLASVELKPAGSPEGTPVFFPYSDDPIDVTPEDGQATNDDAERASPRRVVTLGFSEDDNG